MCLAPNGSRLAVPLGVLPLFAECPRCQFWALVQPLTPGPLIPLAKFSRDLKLDLEVGLCAKKRFLDLTLKQARRPIQVGLKP